MELPFFIGVQDFLQALTYCLVITAVHSSP